MNQMQQMLMNAQRMQRELDKARAVLAQTEFKASKAGMIELTMMGDRTIKEIKIDKEALDPENAEDLEEAIRLALNEALEKINKASDEIEEKVTGRTGLF